MSTRTLIIIASCAIIATAFAVAWHKARLLRQAESSLSAMTKQRASMDVEVRHMEERFAATEKDRADLQVTLDGLPKAKANAAGASKKASSSEVLPTPMEQIMKDPKLQNLFLASQRAGLATSYGPFFRRLGLTPAQIEKFEEIMIKRAEQNMDLRAAAQSQGLPPDSPTLATLRKQAEEELQAAQAGLLGPAGYEQLQQYERTVGVREMVQRFAGAAVLEAMPLTAAQAERLAQVLAEANPSYQRGGPTTENEPIDWAVADRQLTGVLSEAQLSLFQQIEPMGGGPSRFHAQLQSTFQQAVKADSSTPPPKSPSG